MLRYKKAQTGETISWIVATLVIVEILLIFIWVSVLMSKTKIIGIGNLKTDLAGKSERLETKTSLAYQISGDRNKEVIDNLLREDGK